MTRPTAIAKLLTVLLLLSAGAWSARAQDPGAPGTITGAVTGVDDDLLPTVLVGAYSADSTDAGFETYSIPVDPDGTYRLDVAAGTYVVVAASPEYEMQFYDGAGSAADATPVVVAAGDRVEGIDFELRRPGQGSGSISGTVRADGDGTPISGARIRITSPLRWNVAFDALTGADGTYVVDGLAGGPYVVRASAAGFVAEWYDDAPSTAAAVFVHVEEPAETDGIDFSLERAGSIAGIVFGSDGQAFEGAIVTAWASSPGDSTGTVPSDSLWIGPDGTMVAGTDPVRTTSGPDGRYVLDGIPTGSYFVSAEGWAGRRFVQVWYDGVRDPSMADSVDVTAGAVTEGIDFALPLAGGEGVIAGRVVDESGTAVEGALVSAHDADATVASDCCGPWQTAMTGPDGRYELTMLPPGDYLVSASARSEWIWVERWYPDAGTPADAVTVPVERDLVTADIDIVLPVSAAGASIAGTVSEAGGNALESARVLVETLDDPTRPTDDVPVQAWAVTDGMGHYEVDGLPPGTYTVSASWWDGDRYAHAWYDGASVRVDATPVGLQDGEARDDIDIVLEPEYRYGALGGVVVDADGLPLERALVQVQHAPGTGDFAPFRYREPHAVTDADGRFVIERLPVGAYLVRAYADGAFAWYDRAPVPQMADPIEVVGGQTADVRLELDARDDGPGTIEGRVTIDMQVDWADSVVTGQTTVPDIAVVIARPTVTILSWPESERFFTAVTREDGTYSLGGLPEGEYLVRAFAPSYVEEYFRNAFVPSDAQPVTVNGDFPTTGIDFDLIPMYWFGGIDDAERAGGDVRGIVRDQAGEPVGDATVYLVNLDGITVASTRTDADGTYAFEGVAPGYYRVMVVKEGFDPGFNGGATRLEDAGLVPVTTGETDVDLAMRSGTATGEEPDSELPPGFVLRGNYPNPFNPATTILVDLPEAADVTVQVFDLLGRRVFEHEGGFLSAGEGHNLRIDASGLPSGMYLYRVQAVGVSRTWQGTGRMTLLK